MWNISLSLEWQLYERPSKLQDFHTTASTLSIEICLCDEQALADDQR